jgi:hypothetical protein
MTLSLLFVLSLALILLLQVGATDALRFLRLTIREVEDTVGHDSLIFPDYHNTETP